MKKFLPYINIALGALILSFGLYNIHSRCGISEGGELGMELLLLHWFNLSPALSALIFDAVFYSIGVLVLGKGFIKYALAATACYALSYSLWSSFPPLLPDLSAHPLAAAILGALFVGLGCGLVVRSGGACSGDDALALALSTKLKLKIEYCYWISDISVLLLSLSYIPLRRIMWSLLTVTLSSWLVGLVQRFELKQKYMD